ncbi:MAG TPA: RNA polymerase sigma factor [Kofleriaceae bacterium]
MTRDRELRLVPASSTGTAVEDRSDEDLMVATGAGSRDAFAVLVARYLGRIESYCAKLTTDDRTAEELAQEVMLAVWRTRGAYRPAKPFRVFVFTIASNRCRNHARSWRRRLRWFGFADPAAEPDHLPALEPGQLDRVLEIERQRRVRAALGALPARARNALVLRFEHDLSYAEIAQIAGGSEGTARSHVFHALRKLQRLLEEDAA